MWIKHETGEKEAMWIMTEDPYKPLWMDEKVMR